MTFPIDGTLALGLLLLGGCTGFLAGLLGIGGGMVLVPFMTLLLGVQGFLPEHLVKVAVATSLATICFTSISSVRAHHQRGAVRWDIVRRLTPGILLGAVIGAQVAKALPSQGLAAVFALFVGFSATQMFLDKKPKPSRELPGTPGMLGAGGAIGTVSAIVGAGGGFLSVPFMTWCNVTIHNAVATSAARGLPIALAGTAGYVYAGWSLQGLPPGTVGFIFLPALLIISSASVFTAPLGARTAHRMDVKQLKRAFACVLYLLAAYMFYKAFG